MTWNATGIMSSSSYLCNLLRTRKIDICGISEHWLSESNVHFFDSLSNNSRCHVVCDSSLAIGNQRRMGKGGVAIMWQNKYDYCITPVDIDDDNIAGIQMQISANDYMYMFQVYLPCSNHSIDIFADYIWRLYDIYNKYADNGTVVFMGDFNADISISANNPRTRLLRRLLIDCNMLAVNTLPECRGSNCTFVSYDSTCRTTIDYICLPVETADLVLFSEIIDDDCLNVSRHKPVL